MPAVMPEMQRMVVESQGWATPLEFVQLFAIAQAAPGPNVLIVSLVGWKLAGVPGALAATAAMCAPSSVLAFIIGRLAHRFERSRVRVAIQNGVGPITIGIVLASGYLLACSADQNWIAYVITAGSALVALKTRLHPLWLLVAGAVLGLAGAVP